MEEKVPVFCLGSRYQASPNNLHGVTQIFKEQAVPLVSRQTGFEEVYLMTRPSGELMVLDIRDTEDQANAWPQNSQHQQVAAQLKPLLSGAPVRDGYVYPGQSQAGIAPCLARAVYRVSLSELYTDRSGIYPGLPSIRSE